MNQKKVIKHKLDFRENVDYSILLGRDVIYLDMNIWIDLADGRTLLANTVKDLFKILVNDKKLFCPLYVPLLSELYSQEPSSMRRVGNLMEELSLDFCFVTPEEVWQKEVKLFLRMLLEEKIYKIPKNNLFIPFIGYLSSRGTLNYPADIPEEEAKKMTAVIKNNLKEITLNRVLELVNERKAQLKNYSEKLRSEYRNIWLKNDGNKIKIRIHNQNFVAKEKILPIIQEENRKLEPEQVYKITRYINSFPKDERKSVFNSIIDLMPSLRNEVELTTVMLLDKNRNFTINDFYDIENLIVPLAYSDVFISRDRWIRHLLNITDLPNKNGCKYFYDLNELVKYLSNRYLN